MTDSVPSTHRERQREQTIQLIMASFSELTMSNPQFTMQELADQAGISVRTLYRYFPSREALREGLTEMINQHMDRDHVTGIGAMDEGTEFRIHHSFRVFTEHDKLMRAVVVSRLTGALTDPAHQTRADAIRAGADLVLADQPELLRRQIAGLVRLLGGSVGWMTLTDSTIPLSSEEAASAVAWAMRVLTEAARDEGKVLE